MRSIFLRILALTGFAFVSIISANADAPHTRVTYPSTVSVEMLGRAMLYSVNFDQVFNDNIAAGFGLGSAGLMTPVLEIDVDQSATFLPAYMNYYFLKEAGSPFLTVGMTLITNHSSVKNLETKTGNLEIPSSNVMPTFGGGYENRTDTGFLFRAAAYFVAARKLTPWLGFSLGFSF